MIVLHGVWFEDAFHLWGEADVGAPRAADRSPAAGAVHPAALAVADLHAALGELSPDGLLASIAREASLSLWLPASRGAPLASTDPHVSAAEASDGSIIELAVFTVPTLTLAPADAIDLLVSLPLPQPRSCADSIRYWSRLARYVAELLARGQFVPELEGNGANEARACWRAVVRDDGERRWLQRVAAAMPPACRAVVAPGERRSDAVTRLESFVQSGVDAMIRRVLDEDPFFQQIHDRAAGGPWEMRWLSALMGDDRRLPGPDDERVAFANQLRSWISKVDEGDRAIPTKLCLELCEPDEDGPDEPSAPPAPAGAPGACWRLEFHLQSLDGSGRRHELAEAFADDGGAPAILRRRLANRREQLLAELSRAADVFPRIADALKSAQPVGIALTALEACAFMRDCAPLLEARGFGVTLPAWAAAPQRRLGLRLFVGPSETAPQTGSVAAAGLGLAGMVDFEWRVAVGDNDLTLEEFEQLRAQSASLVRLRGEWMFVDAEAAETAAHFLAEQRRGRMTLGQALRAANGLVDLPTGLPVVGLDAAGWLERLLRDAAGARLERLEQPADFNGTLRPYQLRGLEWLAFMDRVGIGACLADDMGLGKTIQLIALLLEERAHRPAAGPTLIFTPMSVVGNWQREIERFGRGLRVFVHHGPDRLSGEAFRDAAARADAVVTTYALGHRDLETLQRVAWHRVVLDEAQKVKNPSAAQTIAIRALPSTYRVALTGTPLENHLSELWSIMEMLNPGLLGSASDFRKRFSVPIERLGDAARAQQLKRMIHPFVLRRVKSDPDVECDLPEKMEMRVFCNLTVEQAALYEQVVAAALGEVEQATGIRRRGVILAALTHLKQICNHPAHFQRDGSALDGRSGKCERLAEMLEEVLAEGDAALVFTQFREMGELLIRLLTERLHTEVLFLHGGTSAKQRQVMVDRFQDPTGGARIFLLSLRAGGLGLNLTAANHVFHFDRWWNPAVEEQATDRAYRIGQVQRVQVHKFVCIGTIEDRIDRMLSEKTALAERIVGSGDDWITGLSTEELRQYLTLSREAVGDF